jgi:hypothetical protein
MSQFEYDDDYPTCKETFSILRIYSDKVNPDEITKIIEINPTKFFWKGEVLGNGYFRKKNGWFYCTENLTKSKDTRRHIDLIIETLEGKETLLNQLRQQGCKLDIFSYWASCGHGGPMLCPSQMLKLASLEISIGWDVYFKEEIENNRFEL